MVTDDIQELLDGGMDDGRMAELLHTLSVSPEKRKAFRDHLLIEREMKDDRYASALTFSEDAAIWESIAAAGAGTAAGASGAGRVVGAWAGRIAALAVVGVAGYLLGTSTTNVGSDGDAPVIVQRTTGEIASSGTDRSAQDAAGSRTDSRSGSRSDGPTDPATSSTGRMAAPPLALGTSPRFPERQEAGRARLSSSRLSGSRDMSAGTASRAAARSTSAQQAAGQMSAASDEVGSLEFAREMFTALGGSSSAVSQTNWVVPATENGGNGNGNGGSANASTSHGSTSNGTATAPQQRVDTASRPVEAALRISPDAGIPIEGEETQSPVSALLTDGFQLAFSERLGMLISGSDLGSSSDQSFSYHTVDLSYHLNGGRFGFGARLGYGSFSRVQIEEASYSNTSMLATPEKPMIPYVATSVQSRQVSYEGFVNYRHPLTNRIAVSLEAYVGGSSTHQQGGLEVSAIGFITDNFGVQLGGGAGNYWYDMTAEYERAESDPNTSLDYTKNAYRGVMLLGRYGMFYRF